MKAKCQGLLYSVKAVPLLVYLILMSLNVICGGESVRKITLQQDWTEGKVM
jgi:hypothetical protein